MLTTKEISEYLKVSEETVRRWIRNKELVAEQEGKSYKVREENLEKFIAKKSTETGTSISKMATLLGGVGNVIGKPATAPIVKGLAGVGAAAISKTFSKGTRKAATTGTTKFTSMEDIEYAIDSLLRQKKIVELEFQMKQLEIDQEIAKLNKLKDQM